MTAIVILQSLRVHLEKNIMSRLVYGIIRLIGTNSNDHERNSSFYHIFLLGLQAVIIVETKGEAKESIAVMITVNQGNIITNY